MERSVKFKETGWENTVFCGGDDAVVESFGISACGGFYKTETATPNSWVNAEYFHDIIVS